MIQLGGAVSDVPDDATAYSGRSASFFWLIQPIWDATADDVSSLAWGRKYGSALAGPLLYANHALRCCAASGAPDPEGELGLGVIFSAPGAVVYFSA